ncbi:MULTISPECIES: glycoside hydrolase family 26 protein [Halococcus]|uniref:Endoglucanase family protein n=1 Tax=Halococcus salifodinae DSM 8989 TaxID=1227456 RepID=M0NA64_9EURY|nr:MULTISPECIES: glycosyl hydrolase [Halococcus]EMA53515.1 endoglucanase family protein [Halococcus salifodinae DSM 8989]
MLPTDGTDKGTPGDVDDSGGSSDSSGRSGTFLTGTYNGERGFDSEAFGTWLGRKPAVTELFVDALAGEAWVETFVRTRMTPIWNRGQVPLVVWQPYRSPRERTPADVERKITDGTYDDIIRAWARELASWAKPTGSRDRRFYFVPAEEMNGDWYPWGVLWSDGGAGPTTRTGSPRDYVGMWRHLHNRFEEEGMDERVIQWVWTPNADQAGDIPTERYYPGDEYVDWIGLNGFNYGDINQYSRWQTPEERFGSMIDRMKALADKPLAFPEVSSTSFVDGAFRPSRKAEWIEQLVSFATDENIELVCWYNFDDTGTWESDWAVFGGEHGTSAVTIDNKRYPVYNAYRRETKPPTGRDARPDHPRSLTNDEFAGRF